MTDRSNQAAARYVRDDESGPPEMSESALTIAADPSNLRQDAVASSIVLEALLTRFGSLATDPGVRVLTRASTTFDDRLRTAGFSIAPLVPTVDSADSSPADAVVVSASHAHTADSIAALAQAYQVLAPGGVLLLCVHDPSPRRRRGRTLRDEVATALFGAGFVSPTFRETTASTSVVEATRGASAPPADRRLVLSVVMPMYNERDTFEEVLDGLLAKEIDGVDIEVIVVESNSSDGTREALARYGDHPRVQLVLEDKAEGKGHAVRGGLAKASGDFVLIQDADLEYDLDDYDKLLVPLRKLEASFVLGARTRTDGARFGVRHFERQVVIGRLMNVGNAMFLALFNFVYGERLVDPFTMYKVMRRDCLHTIKLECDRFDFDWEIMAKMLRAGYRPIEIPVRYQSRSFEEGKKISIFGDPFSWVVACFRYRFAPFEN